MPARPAPSDRAKCSPPPRRYEGRARSTATALLAAAHCLAASGCSSSDDRGDSSGTSGAGGAGGSVAGTGGVAGLGGAAQVAGGTGGAATTSVAGSASSGAGASSMGGNGSSGQDPASGGAAGGGGMSGAGGAGLDPYPAVPLDSALLEHCTGKNPIVCTLPVPANGNYDVTVELGSAQAASTSRVQAELYRIVVPPVALPAGMFSRHTFSVNVRAEDHDGYDAPGKQLDILIDGEAPALHGLGYAAANLPTLFVVGDSTVCDWDPAAANLGPLERGWAQEISQFLKPGLAVANYADSGDTAGSLYGKFASRGAVMKEGDYLFIQFGHNDQKSQSDINSYKSNLMKFVDDARSAKATPILFSPVARKSATLASTGFAGLDQQARELAQAENIAFVDLTKLAIEYYGGVPDKSLLFATSTEGTHFSIVGATAISELVAGALEAGTTPATSIREFIR